LILGIVGCCIDLAQASLVSAFLEVEKSYVPRVVAIQCTRVIVRYPMSWQHQNLAVMRNVSMDDCKGAQKGQIFDMAYDTCRRCYEEKV
jgi:hypothetical protein